MNVISKNYKLPTCFLNPSSLAIFKDCVDTVGLAHILNFNFTLCSKPYIRPHYYKSFNRDNNKNCLLVSDEGMFLNFTFLQCSKAEM